MKEFDIRALLGIDEVATASQEEQGQEIVIYDYEQEVKKVRNAYVDLINTYGASSGKVIEERRHPKPTFSMFRITSRRKCPEVVEAVGTGTTLLSINLESREHTELLTRHYDPATLTQIFPDDSISLNLKVKDKTSSASNWQDRTFNISQFGVTCFTLSSADFPMSDNLEVSEFISSKAHKATPEELEVLLLLHPILEAKYQSMQPSLPLPNPRPRFLKWP